MEWVETTAKTVPEAKDLALDKLGVDESESEFEVLEEPRQGLFGRTRGQARVRARVKPKAPRAKDDRRERRRKKGKPKSETGGSDQPTRPKTAKSDSAAGGGRSSSAEKTEGNSGPRRKSSSSDSEPNGSGRARGDRSDTRRSGQPKADRPQKKEASMDEVRSCVEEFLTGLTAAFEIDTTVSIDETEEQIMAKIEGKHGLLLGPKARTLDAIQELTRVTAQRTAPSTIRIKVDVGGYREARKASLEKFALDAAEKARDEGVDVRMEAMNSADRKTVHDALTDEPGVSTRSAGTDPRRFVVVVPDDASESQLDESDDADD